MDIQKVLKGVGVLVGAFNPAIGGAIVSVSDVAGALVEADDDNLENVSGLGYISKGLRDLVAMEDFDKDKILEYAKMIDDVSLILEKNYKLIR